MRRDKLILLIDDNQDEVELALRAFRRAQVQADIQVAGDGLAALDFLFATGAHAGRDPSIKPHVVLLDLKLPKIEGIDVLRRMRADPRTRRIPVVALSTSVERVDLEACYDLGVNSFIRKPLNFGSFVETAQIIGAYWLERNEPPP